MTGFTILMLVTALIFGIIYAVYIAWRPFSDEWTWASVVIGVFCTILPFSLAIYDLTHDLELALLIYFFFTATGGPMILGQVLKHFGLDLKADNDKSQLEQYVNNGTDDEA